MVRAGPQVVHATSSGDILSMKRISITGWLLVGIIAGGLAALGSDKLYSVVGGGCFVICALALILHTARIEE